MGVGRNQLCPCGSGRKAKKCCFSNQPQSPRRPDEGEVTLESLAQTKDVTRLPVLGNVRMSELLDSVIDLLESPEFLHFDVGISTGGAVAFNFFFEAPSESDDDDFGFGVDEVRVEISEASAGGGLRAGAMVNSHEVSPLELPVETGAAMFLVWLTVSNKAEEIEVSRMVRSQAEKLSRDLRKARKAYENVNKKEQAETLRLQSLNFEGLILAVSAEDPLGVGLQSTDLERLLPDRLPKLTRLQAANKKLSSVKGSLELRRMASQVPEIFLSDDGPYSAFYGQRLNEELADCVFYRFSDGSVISSRHILRSTEARLVPPDLLPGGIEIPSALWQGRFKLLDRRTRAVEAPFELRKVLAVDNQAAGYSFGVHHVEGILWKVLLAAFHRLDAKQITIDLVFGRSKGRPVDLVQTNSSCLRLDVASLSELKPSFACEFSEFPVDQELFTVRARLKQSVAASGSMALSFGSIELQPRKSLQISDLKKKVEQLRFLESGSDDGERVRIAMEKSEASGAGQQGVSSVIQIESVGLTQTRRVLAAVEIQKHPEARESAAQPEVVLDKAGRAMFVRRLEAESDFPFLAGFSDAVIEVISLLSGGFCRFFGAEAKEIATRSSQSRDFELKLLKHQGIANLIVHETLNARLKGRLSDGQEIRKPREILKALESKILVLMGRSVHGEDPESDFHTKRASGAAKKFDLDHRCTKSLLDRLEKFVGAIYNIGRDARYQAVLPSGVVNVTGGIDDELRLLLALMDFAALASKGEIYGKPRVDLAGKLLGEGRDARDLGVLLAKSGSQPSFSGARSPFLRIPYGDQFGGGLRAALMAVSGLVKDGLELFYEGAPVESLSEDQLRTELTMTEKDAMSAAASETGGARAINWFELHPKVFLHGREIGPEELAKVASEGLIAHAGRVYLVPAGRLPTLQRLAKFWQRLARGAGAARGNQTEGSAVLQVPRCEALEMLALRKSGVPVIGGARWREICAFYDSLTADAGSGGRVGSAFEAPAALSGILKDYQKTGVHRLYQLHRLGLGAILADDMGLGKTIQALALLDKLREERRLGATLVVVPTSLTYNWLAEAERFTPALRFRPFSGKIKEQVRSEIEASKGTGDDPVIVLATYGLLQEHREFFLEFDWSLVIFDEAQNLKNISAQRTNVARALRAETKVCLTGTPLENHLGELYSLVDLAVPGALGGIEEFRQVYVNPPALVSEDVAFLKLKTKPLILRRTKSEILLELPEKQESRVVLPFESKQKKIYRDIAIAYNDQIQQAIADNGESKCQLQMLTALLRLRQACSDPAALPGVKYETVPPKIEALTDALSEITESGESALVFTQFLRTLEHAEKCLKKAGLRVFTMHGGHDRKRREESLREFNDSPGGSVLIMTLKTGGVGLNLTKASYVFHLEPWWNPAVESQATDRAHRIGQRRAVQVYRYIMHESVEEKIEQLKARKQATFDAIFTPSVSAERVDEPVEGISDMAVSRGRQLTKADFEYLLS